MSNALHDYAMLFEKYAARNGGTGAILPGEDCLSLANEMRMDADAIEAENAKLRELCVKALEWLRWAGGITCPAEVPDEFADELRDLGIEVDA